jgi:hypothetical protein
MTISPQVEIHSTVASVQLGSRITLLSEYDEDAGTG